MYSTGTAYLLWLLGGFGVLGFHRIYLKKYGTAAIWFFTGGLGGVGCVYDLVTLPSQVREANLQQYYRSALNASRATALPPRERRELPARESIERVILRCARKNSGYVTAAEVALEGDISIGDSKTALEKLAAKGYAEMRIRTNGVLVYVFAEFQKEGERDFAV
jgi:TM2 domain-containing membrane protein YozV